jgi:hypothetical protein
VSAFASGAAPATTFNSISSRSFRRNVMMQSISAFFSRHKEPAHSRNPSDATTVVTESPSDDRPKDASAEEKDLGISPVPLAVSQTKDHEKAESSSSTSSPKEAEATPDGKQDPFAGGVEGGVTYRTMRWW